MAEKCAKCSVTAARVEIGGRSYCGSCGEAASLTKAVSTRTMNDLGKSSKPTVLARTARDLHQRQGMAKGGVVDLRTPHNITGAKAKIVRKSLISTTKPTAITKPVLVEKVSVAKLTPRHEKITRFHAPATTIVETPAPQVSMPKAVISPAPKAPVLPAHVETHHRAMAALAKPHLKPTQKRSLGRYASVGTAVAIMAGYVWFQNVPKLELHSASSKAGFALTLPAYLPSSYSLNGPVEASHGFAVISFKSASIQTPLRITQQLTTWDSSSLRDNVLTAKSDNVTSIQGQGLTIYLWGKTQAAWVNHGIWYGIEGAGQLSREQILKIAYSL
ncbi:MAG: hypothetical protein ABIS59_00400 [Candidatus Saccharibacteria bacterium]